MSKTYFIKTYGCQMNYSDSERVSSKLSELGFAAADSEDTADMVLFNTCSIRQKAEDKVFGSLEHLHKQRKHRPNLIVGVTGCMVRNSSTTKSEKRDKLLSRVDSIDFVFRIDDLVGIRDLMYELKPSWFSEESSCQNPEQNYFSVKPNYTDRYRAFVPIMTGCDKFCSYCIVPFTRGREKSRPADEILAECKKLVENGCKEITLLGQNVNSYGLSPIDFTSGEFSMEERVKMGLRTNLENPPFVQLLKRIDRELHPLGLSRLRYTSSHPYDMSLDLIKAHGELPSLCNHIHLPIQSGSDAVLKRMNRHYTISHIKMLLKTIKETLPRVGLTTDIIVGFCGETEAEFQETCDLFREAKFDMSFTGKYSPRKGTMSAEKLPDDVSNDDKKRRWHELNDLMKDIVAETNKDYVGQELEVLVERKDGPVAIGRSREFKEVHFRSEDPNVVGTEVPVKIIAAKQWILVGEAV